MAGGKTNFSIKIEVKNDEAFSEIKGRLLDLRPAYNAFVKAWANINKDIFESGAGAEVTGADVDADVFWEPLSAGYRKAKQAEGYADHLMVATGALMRALTNPDLVFQAIGPQDAIFGSPLSLEEADKVKYNWESRQTVFFSGPDQRALRRILKYYLTMGEGFEQKRFEAGLSAVQQRAEVAQMDLDFANDIDSDTGVF